MPKADVMEFTVHYRWWVEVYLWCLRQYVEFVQNYIDMEAQPDMDKVLRIVGSGIYLTGPDGKRVK